MSGKKDDDYGYFGKGIDGYVHYKQALDENFKRNQVKSTSNNSINSSQNHTNQNVSNRMHPQQQDLDNDNSNNTNYHTTFWLILTWLGMVGGIIGAIYLLGYLLIGTASGADSFGGIIILIGGAILIMLL